MTEPLNLFIEYTKRKSVSTITAQQRDLRLFLDFLHNHSLATTTTSAKELQTKPDTWADISYTDVQQFVDWQLREGHAISSINRRLSTIKNYAKLSTKSGQLDSGEYALMTTLSGYSSAHAQRIDRERSTKRIGKKKLEPAEITKPQADQLKDQPNTPQGRRDRLLMCLLLDHGLRVGEVTLLQARNFDSGTGIFCFERPNLDGEQFHKFTDDTRRSLQSYIQAGDCPKDGALLRGSLKSGELTYAGISARAIQARVRLLGEQIGLFGLSPHDCRHYWATYWSDKVDVLRLQEAGGWSSLEMPRRYVERSRIANIGMTDK